MYSSFVVSVLQLLVYLGSALGDGRVVVKRQSSYYLCGVYPNQYYSTVPCYANTCSNGGQLIGVGCLTSAQCTPYYRGVSSCINGCCCTSPSSNPSGPLPPPPPSSSSPFGVCASGQLSQVQCTMPGQCAQGQTCMNGLCCTTIGNEYQYACGGLGAIASCSPTGTCPSSTVCTASNYCCECPVGRSSGRCVSGSPSSGCPSGFVCTSSGYCCSSCPSGVSPLGACRNGACSGGRTCAAGNICC